MYSGASELADGEVLLTPTDLNRVSSLLGRAEELILMLADSQYRALSSSSSGNVLLPIAWLRETANCFSTFPYSNAYSLEQVSLCSIPLPFSVLNIKSIGKLFRLCNVIIFQASLERTWNVRRTPVQSLRGNLAVSVDSALSFDGQRLGIAL